MKVQLHKEKFSNISTLIVNITCNVYNMFETLHLQCTKLDASKFALKKYVEQNCYPLVAGKLATSTLITTYDVARVRY